MKLVPAFFLLGFTIIHLIYVIAIPNVPKADLEKVERRKAAALSRFNRSKRNAPVRYSPKRYSGLSARLSIYLKYARITCKRFFASKKPRLDTRIAEFRKGFLRYLTSAHDLRLMRSSRHTRAKRTPRSGIPALQNGTKINTVFPKIGTRAKGDAKKFLTWPFFQVTASAYETFKEVAEELASSIRRMAVNEIPKTIVLSLKESGFRVGRVRPNEFAKYVANGWSPITTPLPLLQSTTKRQESEDLTSSTYVPVPSAAPTVEPLPETSLETVAAGTFEQTPEIHDVNVSWSPETSDAALTNEGFYLSAVITFRKLADFAARV